MSAETSAEETVHIRTCPLCEAVCGLEIRVRGGAVVGIRGDEQDVLSHGYVCPKGAMLKHLHEDPDRLRRPLVRRDGALEEVSWEEAFAEVERGFAAVIGKYGPQAFAAYLGNPNTHNLAGRLYVRPFLKALGTRNIFTASTIDQMAKHVSSGALFGSPGAIPVPDLDRTQYLLMLGANPAASNGSLCTAPNFPGRLRAIQERGGRVVVVDPRRTRSARDADEHLFIRPGTDAHFLLALVYTLFDEEKVSLGALAPHVNGVDALRSLVLDFAPETVGPVCRIAPATIRRVARELAAAESAAVYGRMGVQTVEFGTLASWASDVLNVLTGNLDRPGGAMFPLPAERPPKTRAGGRGFTTGRWRSRVRELPEVMSEFPVATLADEIETPGENQVRAFVSIAGNPVLSAPESARLDAALATLEFMVSVDPYCNETTRHANVILPPPSPLERSHYDLFFSNVMVRNTANFSPAIFAPDGPREDEILARLALIAGGDGASADPRSVDAALVTNLAERLTRTPESPVHGREPAEIVGALGDRPGPERVLDLMLRAGAYGDGFGARPDGLSLAALEAKQHGIDLGALEPRVPELLATPSAKIELVSSPIESDLPRLVDALSRPDDGLRLIGRRDVRSNNSWMHNLAPLVRGKDRCTLLIHPDDAGKLGLGDGEVARVTSRVGEVHVAVELTHDIMPGVVCLPHGWGHDREGTRLSVASRRPGVNFNVLSDGSVLDLPSGTSALNAIPVTVNR